MDKMVTIYIAVIGYAIYLTIKFILLYKFDKKFRERADQQKQKSQRRKIRVRDSRPDRSSFPF